MNNNDYSLLEITKPKTRTKTYKIKDVFEKVPKAKQNKVIAKIKKPIS